ncbi:Phytanoyl-CoA dioxygenase (PhyH) [Polystyrenella longa]|uniref:Phytanoyl-CoA dioxygenase (PhyH) n=1 Tax=Polystyrenella longa TaxID=2528007 RepID=A0A518CSS0_9PLAN|nr:phytanoyl-CoA dioxygenase family protein [Polystyrenella longa]QDU82281.1 Phytanoyl-CoA dioxygenase (PhyH) [Polystyrenella longa]
MTRTATASPICTFPPGNFFSKEEVAQFQREGYIIVRNLADSELVEQMRKVTRKHLDETILPVEFEADVKYPGSPMSRDSVGGHTIRRLKQAHARDVCFTEWVSSPQMLGRLSQLLGPELVMPLAHHNCIMTKQPRFSSRTGWHQDIRYWSYQRPELVNAWLALDHEESHNGCLQIIPRSHRMNPADHAFDQAQFFSEDDPKNQALVNSRIEAELQPGDVLFFHVLALHAASENVSEQTKHSVVFTFRPADNKPTPGSRSAALPELMLPAPPAIED